MCNCEFNDNLIIGILYYSLLILGARLIKTKVDLIIINKIYIPESFNANILHQLLTT